MRSEFALGSNENDIVEASLAVEQTHSARHGGRLPTGKPTSKKIAISSIASRPGEPSADALLKIYDSDQTIEIRRSVISGFGNRKSERAGR
jgi:hypothetical protein